MAQYYSKANPNAIPPSSSGATGVPVELQRLDQWLAYRAVPKPNGKINKPPIDAKTGKSGSSTNQATWSGYELAAKHSPVGAAFVLTPDDPYFAIDLDQCVDPETGAIEPWAMAVVNRFPMYWEISYSKTGLRGIGRGVLPKDGCKKGNIEVYDHARLVVMTGRTLPGHETIRNCQQQLIKWHNEVWPIAPARPVPPPSTPSSSTSLNLDDLLAKAFGAKNGDKVRRLHEGDISGYPESQSDPGFSSEADLALAGYYCFYTPDDGLVAEAMRAGKLYRKKMDRQDYIDRTIERVRKNQTEWWDPNHGSRAPLPMIVPPVAVGANCDAQLKGALETIAIQAAELKAAKGTIATLRERVRRGDERWAVARNTKLGAERQTAAVLPSLFQDERAEEPTSTTGYRVPLDRLADRTGLSPETCSKHLQRLATYRTADGTPVLHVETRYIPPQVNQSTGEIVIGHKEVWIGPGPIQQDAFGHVLATLAPAEAPKHGGAPDRNACPDHPFAGVIRRTKTTRKVTRECAHCNTILNVTIVPIGTPTAEFIPASPPIQQDAFGHESGDPNQHPPMPQHAASTSSHTHDKNQSSKMRHSPPPGEEHRSGSWNGRDGHDGVAGDDTWTGAGWRSAC
jgi:hypothetical protein